MSVVNGNCFISNRQLYYVWYVFDKECTLNKQNIFIYMDNFVYKLFVPL